MTLIKTADKPADAFSLLFLTPMLAVSGTLVKALCLLMVLWCVELVCAVGDRVLHGIIGPRGRLAASALLAIALVSCAVLALQAVALDLYRGLGIYLPLLVVFGPIASLHARSLRTRTGLLIGYSLLMLSLAIFREVLGNGTLLTNARWLFGSQAANWPIEVISAASTIHIVTSLPGGLILLGLLLAAINALSGSPNTAKLDLPPAKEKRTS